MATAVSRVTGYLRVLALAYAMGATTTVVFKGIETRVADSYNLANIMPNMIYELVMGGVLSSLFIPIFIEYLNKDKDEAWYVASNVINIFMFFTLVVAFFGYLFAHYLVRLMTLTSTVKAATLAVFFFKVFVWQIIFYGFCSIFTGILNAHRKFTAPFVSPIFNNLTVILTVILYVYLSQTGSPYALPILAIGTTLGVAVMAAVQIPSLLKLKVRYRLIFDFNHPSIHRLFVLAVPIVGYVITNQIGLAVINNLAWQFKGGVTAYQYSWQFVQLPYGIFAVSIITALFPELSEQAAQKDMTRFKKSVSLGLRTTGLIIVPATVFLFILAKPIISVFLQYGNFDIEATRITAPVLSLFALGLLPFSAYMMLTRVYYAMQDTVTPLKTNAIGVPLNIILNILLVQFIEVRGLAVGWALTYAFTASLLFYLLRRRVGPLGGRAIAKSLSKYVVAAIPAGFLIYGLGEIWRSFGASQLVSVLQIVFSGLLLLSVYLLVTVLLKVDELGHLKKLAASILPASRS
jgi:putative peptidoglycan lipid II flippase